MSSQQDTSEILDGLENAWAAGGCPDIRQFICDLTAIGDEDACLVAIASDLEWRWKVFYASKRLSECFRAEQYKRIFPELLKCEDRWFSLMQSEWLARTRWGDEPAIDDFLVGAKNRWTLEMGIAENWKELLVRSLDEIRPLITSVESGETSFQFACPTEFVIGRRQASDPQPVSWVEDRRRLVVATERQRVVSRQQLQVCRVRLNEVEVTNQSRNVSVSLGRELLNPGDRMRVATPFSIHFPDVVIHIGQDRY